MGAGPLSGELVIVRGQQWVDKPSFPLRADVVRVGRDVRGEHDLLVSSQIVSKLHAEFTWDDDRLILTPIAMTNPTWVGDRQVEQPTEVRSGDIISFADPTFALEVRINRPSSSATTEHRSPHVRRLVALVHADVQNYTTLMQQDEPRTTVAVRAWHTLFAALARSHRGRVVDHPGDAILLEFPSVSGALEASLEFLQRVNEAARTAINDQAMLFRVGLHAGEVLPMASGEIFGSTVNKTQRVEAAGTGGRLMMSGVAREMLAKVPDGYTLSVVDDVSLKGFPGQHRLYEAVPVSSA